MDRTNPGVIQIILCWLRGVLAVEILTCRRRSLKIFNKEIAMSESKRYVHPLKRFAGKTFLRRRTTTTDISEEKQACLLTIDGDEKRVSSLTTDVNEKPALSPARVSASEPPSNTVLLSRSRIPTPSASSRRHTCSSRLNAVFSPPLSPQRRSKIPRSTTMRPSIGFSNVAGEGAISNQDGRYPSLATQDQKRTENQRRSERGTSKHPFRDSHSQPIHRIDAADIIMPSRFMTASPSSGPRSDQIGFAEHRNHAPNFSWPLSPRMQPDRNDGETPTMRQFTNLGGPPGIVDPTTLAIHTFENVTTSNSPPISWYRANSDMSKKSSAQTIGLASSGSPSPNYGDYSFDASDETIGLAVTTPIPSGGDIIYKPTIETAESFEFVMPERSNRSSETQGYRPFKSSSEFSEEYGVEVRVSPQMDEENLGALRVSSCLAHLPISFQVTQQDQLTSSALFSLACRLAPPKQPNTGSAV